MLPSVVLRRGTITKEKDGLFHGSGRIIDTRAPASVDGPSLLSDDNKVPTIHYIYYLG